MRPLALISLLTLGACAYDDALIDPSRYRTDASGYALPQNCKASPETVYAPVQRMPRAGLRILTGKDVNGIYNPAFNTIVIADDLGGWRFNDTRAHEQFHAYCQATSDPCCTGHFEPVRLK